MTAAAETRQRDPRPPFRPGMLVAVLLELAIFSTFIANRSVLGVLLCIGYSFFSASWVFFARMWRDD